MSLLLSGIKTPDFYIMELIIAVKSFKVQTTNVFELKVILIFQQIFTFYKGSILHFTFCPKTPNYLLH